MIVGGTAAVGGLRGFGETGTAYAWGSGHGRAVPCHVICLPSDRQHLGFDVGLLVEHGQVEET